MKRLFLANNKLISQLARFAIVGVVAAILDVGVLVFLKELGHIDHCELSFEHGVCFQKQKWQAHQ